VQNCIYKLFNWEILQEQDIKWALKSLKLVQESRILNILVEHDNMDKLIEIIESENFPLEI
jgi:hypothetical protein